MTTEMKTSIYTVSQLNTTVKTLLSETFPCVWVSGEISNLSQPSSGHIYFTLKDANAQVRCAMFRMQQRGLSFRPKDGVQVLVQAQVSLYPNRGDYQLIVSSMEDAGLGKLQREFEALKKQLAEKGWFDAERKKSLPAIPRCVGIVTSPTGAAIRDMISVSQRRFPGIPIKIYPASVQGDAAADEIVRAITLANQQQHCDVLIVSRGGGSLEDLWPFNELRVAEAIYQSQLPVVSGVGHEVDFTISDFVADVRAPTPSAAAETVFPEKTVWQRQFHHQALLLCRSFQTRLQHCSTQLHHLFKRLRHPQQRLDEQSQRLDQCEKRFLQAFGVHFSRQQARLTTAAKQLDLISPLGTLARGYAIVTDENGKALINAKNVAKGDHISVKLHQGQIEATVTKTN
ncbi:MAG: exodeoxyribonuclease 7 large subunit [marine bacterium B5-7]|nr:MAG: exodeoxyribonuclease 7 large subunit [marine bacterium B5-7]